MAKREKMSKSRDNVVLPEEVVRGVCGLAAGYHFRDERGAAVDWEWAGVWRAEDGYRTSTRFGRQPVFLHEDGNPVPCLLRFSDGREMVQHGWHREFWMRLLSAHESEE